MPAIQPVHGKMAGRIAKVLGIPPGTERFVLEFDANAPIRVYVKGYLQIKEYDALVDAFQIVPVADVTVDDDTTVRPTYHPAQSPTGHPQYGGTKLL